MNVHLTSHSPDTRSQALYKVVRQRREFVQDLEQILIGPVQLIGLRVNRRRQNDLLMRREVIDDDPSVIA